MQGRTGYRSCTFCSSFRDGQQTQRACGIRRGGDRLAPAGFWPPTQPRTCQCVRPRDAHARSLSPATALSPAMSARQPLQQRPRSASDRVWGLLKTTPNPPRLAHAPLHVVVCSSPHEQCKIDVRLCTPWQHDCCRVGLATTLVIAIPVPEPASFARWAAGPFRVAHMRPSSLLFAAVLTFFATVGPCGGAAAARSGSGIARGLQQAASAGSGTGGESSLSALLWPVPASYM